MRVVLRYTVGEQLGRTAHISCGCCTDMGTDSEAAHTLHLYNQYKDQTND